jgi:hypothetical protein
MLKLIHKKIFYLIFIILIYNKMKDELKKNLLIVNSYDRKDGDSNNFNYSLGDTSIDIEGISLKSATIPHTYTNVNETNNVLKYSTGTEIVISQPYEGAITINDIVYPYLFTGGVYSQQEFIDAFNNSTTGGGVVKLSYNSGANRYELETISNVDPGLEITQPIYNPTYRNLWVYLGFVSPTTLGNTVGSTTQAPNVALAPFDVEGIQYYEETIAEGQYTTAELLPLITTALSLNVSGPISVTLLTTGSDKGKVQISGATETWKLEPCELATMLGYVPNDMEYTLTQIAQGVPNMYGTLCLFVNSKTLMNGYNALQVGEKSSIISNIPVCSVYEGIDKYEAKYPIWKTYPNSININEFDIFITDDRGNNVDLKNANCCFVFEILTTTRL